MSNEVPEPWASAMTRAGFAKPDGSPNVAALARAVGVHPSTLGSMVRGSRNTEGATIRDVAEALHVDVLDVFAWAGRVRSEPGPFEAHPDADLLTSEERDAVNELIRLLAQSKKRGEAYDRDAAPTSATVRHLRAEMPIELSAEERKRAARRPRRPSEADVQREAQDADAHQGDEDPL